MTSWFPLTNDRLRLWLGAILPAAVVLISVAYWAPVHAQPPDQLTVYSPQTTYSAAMLDIQGHPYVGLIELLEPLGSVDGRVDGKKYKLRFTPPGGHPVEAQFQEGKDKSKIVSENFKLPENFAQQNGRGYVPLSSVPEILTKLLARPVQLHPAARRLFIGDVLIRFSASLDKSNPPKLVLSFPAPVNPTIATEPGRMRLTFRREPVVSSGQDSYSFTDSNITGALFAEHDGLAELNIMATDPLMANFADGGKTIIVSAVPPPPPAPIAPIAPPPTSAQTQTPQAKPPSGPRFLVIIDPGHGGAETGAVITPTLLEKDVALAFGRRVQRELQNRGIAAGLLRNSDVAIALDQRATSTNAARPALYITLHAANTGRGVHLFTSMLPAENLERGNFLPWDRAQAAFLDLSGTVAGSVAVELEARKLPNATLVAPLRPMNNIAAPAIAVEIAPPGDTVEDIASPEYQEKVAQAIAAGVAAVRSKVPEVRP
jgi:N-acetylmuramoyl-L-alanine amidase